MYRSICQTNVYQQYGQDLGMRRLYQSTLQDLHALMRSILNLWFAVKSTQVVLDTTISNDCYDTLYVSIVSLLLPEKEFLINTT